MRPPTVREDAQLAAVEALCDEMGIAGPEDLEPPHRPGGPCPHCARGRLVGGMIGDDEGGLWCDGCDREVWPGDRPSWDPYDVLIDRARDDAEWHAERWEDDR